MAGGSGVLGAALPVGLGFAVFPQHVPGRAEQAGDDQHHQGGRERPTGRRPKPASDRGIRRGGGVFDIWHVGVVTGRFQLAAQFLGAGASGFGTRVRLGRGCLGSVGGHEGVVGVWRFGLTLAGRHRTSSSCAVDCGPRR